MTGIYVSPAPVSNLGPLDYTAGVLSTELQRHTLNNRDELPIRLFFCLLQFYYQVIFDDFNIFIICYIIITFIIFNITL